MKIQIKKYTDQFVVRVLVSRANVKDILEVIGSIRMKSEVGTFISIDGDWEILFRLQKGDAKYSTGAIESNSIRINLSDISIDYILFHCNSLYEQGVVNTNHLDIEVYPNLSSHLIPSLLTLVIFFEEKEVVRWEDGKLPLPRPIKSKKRK